MVFICDLDIGFLLFVESSPLTYKHLIENTKRQNFHLSLQTSFSNSRLS